MEINSSRGLFRAYALNFSVTSLLGSHTLLATPSNKAEKMFFSKENVLDFGEQNVCQDIFLFARCKTFFLDLPTTPYSALYVRGPKNNEIFV
jgi:hypothetical protein